MTSSHAQGPDADRESSSPFQQATSQIKHGGLRLAEAAKQNVEQVAEERKGMAADYLNDVSNAIGKGSQELREQGHGSTAALLGQASDHVGGLAETVARKRTGELVEDLESLARRQPVLFYGAALLLGFGAVRFMRSSVRSNDAGETEESPLAAKNGGRS